MIKNVCNALRKVFPYQEGVCISNTSVCSENESEELESCSEDVIIPEGVSEPVISFVKCFQENPKRFKLLRNSMGGLISSDGGSGNIYVLYILLDKKENIIYRYACNTQEDNNKDYIDVLRLINTNEGSFLISELSKVFKYREKRYQELLTQRKERSQKRLREKLTNIYKGEE